MHSMSSLGLLMIFVLVVTEIAAFPHPKSRFPSVFKRHSEKFGAEVHKILREKRQHGEDCDNAQIALYEHEHGDDCMSIFYNEGSDTFFDPSRSRDFVNTYCGSYKCGDWVPPLMDNITKYCGIDLSEAAELLKASCDQDSTSRDYCLYKWEYLGDIIDGVNSTLSYEFNRCLNRNVTDNPCPSQCKDVLPGISDKVGCCYGDLLALDNIDYLISDDVFTDCGLPIDRPCTQRFRKKDILAAFLPADLSDYDHLKLVTNELGNLVTGHAFHNIEFLHC